MLNFSTFLQALFIFRLHKQSAPFQQLIITEIGIIHLENIVKCAPSYDFDIAYAAMQIIRQPLETVIHFYIDRLLVSVLQDLPLLRPAECEITAVDPMCFFQFTNSIKYDSRNIADIALFSAIVFLNNDKQVV